MLPFHGLGDVAPLSSETSKILTQIGGKIPFSDPHKCKKKSQGRTERVNIVTANRELCAPGSETCSSLRCCLYYGLQRDTVRVI